MRPLGRGELPGASVDGAPASGASNNGHVAASPGADGKGPYPVRLDSAPEAAERDGGVPTAGETYPAVAADAASGYTEARADADGKLRQEFRKEGAVDAAREICAGRRPSPAADFVRKTLVVAEIEVRKLQHDATELLARAIQPALWFLVFGQVFSRIRAIPTGGMRYLDFMAPGVLAQGVLFSSIFYGIALIWERDLGLAHKLLVSPIPRSSIVVGKALSAGVRGLAQAAIVYLLAFIMRVDLRWHPAALLGVVIAIFLGAAVFATLSLLIACLVKTRERFMGIGQLLTMPLFFASNAIYPLEIMPDWLRSVSVANPLTYEVDALRGLMLAGGEPAFGIATDLAVLLAFAVLLSAATSAIYPRVAI